MVFFSGISNIPFQRHASKETMKAYIRPIGHAYMELGLNFEELNDEITDLKDMLKDEEADQSELTQCIHRYVGG